MVCVEKMQNALLDKENMRNPFNEKNEPLSPQTTVRKPLSASEEAKTKAPDTKALFQKKFSRIDERVELADLSSISASGSNFGDLQKQNPRK